MRNNVYNFIHNNNLRNIDVFLMNIVEQNWDLILNKMKLEYCSSNISYTTWIAPLTVYEVKDNTVYILVQLRASLEHIEEKYLLPFKVCIALSWTRI